MRKIFFKYVLYAFLLCCFFLLSTSLIWLIYSQLSNNLRHNGQWSASKLNLVRYFFGGPEFFNGRQALAHNHLNLGVWHGFQEVITQKSYQLASIDFDFHLSNASYFYLVFNKNADQFSAVRISNNSSFPSLFATVKESGEFTYTLPIQLSQNLLQPRWNHLKLIFLPQQKQLAIELNQHHIAQFSTLTLAEQRFGFRGSYEVAQISNVIAKDSHNSIVFRDNFEYRDSHWILKCLSIFLLIAIINIFFLSVLLIMKKQIKIAYFSLVMLNISLLLVLIFVELYMWFSFVYSYQNPNSIVYKWWDQITFQSSYNPWPNAENRQIVNSYHPDAREKVMFIGTSQTWGAGAETVDQTYVKVAESLANANSAATPSAILKYQFINAGISGADSSILLDFYKKIWINFAPKVVVIDLSNNDLDRSMFKKNLEEFVSLNKTHHITTVFMLEANSPEVTPGDLPLHSTMRQVAHDEGIRILDLHEYLKEQKDKGILWWDYVHPTSYGHQLAGQFVFEQIKDLL